MLSAVFVGGHEAHATVLAQGRSAVVECPVVHWGVGLAALAALDLTASGPCGLGFEVPIPQRHQGLPVWTGLLNYLRVCLLGQLLEGERLSQLGGLASICCAFSLQHGEEAEGRPHG